MIGEIYLTGFTQLVPVGTFDRDVPLLGMKYLRGALLSMAAMQNEHDEYEDQAADKIQS